MDTLSYDSLSEISKYINLQQCRKLGQTNTRLNMICKKIVFSKINFHNYNSIISKGRVNFLKFLFQNLNFAVNTDRLKFITVVTRCNTHVAKKIEKLSPFDTLKHHNILLGLCAIFYSMTGNESYCHSVQKGIHSLMNSFINTTCLLLDTESIIRAFSKYLTNYGLLKISARKAYSSILTSRYIDDENKSKYFHHISRISKKNLLKHLLTKSFIVSYTLDYLAMLSIEEDQVETFMAIAGQRFTVTVNSTQSRYLLTLNPKRSTPTTNINNSSFLYLHNIPS